MTVAQLITELSQIPGECEVRVKNLWNDEKDKIDASLIGVNDIDVNDDVFWLVLGEFTPVL